MFRTLDDCHKIAGYANKCRKAAVIGGGLLGLEAARGLINYGVEVHVIHISGHLMNQQLDPAAGKILGGIMEKMGVHVHTMKNTARVLGEDSVTGLEFKDGTTLDCDMVVISTGIKPNAEIGHACGLTVERAIVTDNQMRSVDDPDIYVVGECAQHRGRVYGLVAPLWEMGQVLADHITGLNPNAAYHGSKIATKLKVMGVELASMGVTEPTDERDEVVMFSEPKRGTYKKLIIRDGMLIGAMMLGDLNKVAYLMQAFDRGTPLPEERLSLLFDIGAPSTETTMLEMPDSAQICNLQRRLQGPDPQMRRGRQAVPEDGDGGDAGGRGLRDVQEAGAGGGRVGRRGPGGGGPQHPLLCARRAAAQARLGAGDHGPAVEVRLVPSFDALAGGQEEVTSKMGLASLLKSLWGAEYEDERDARYINDRVHANIQKDKTFSVIPRIYGGVTSAAELRRIADVADKYDVPMVKITGGQRIDLLGITKENLPNVWKDLDMPSGHAYAKSFRTCKTCVGTEFCRYGVGDSTGLGIKIERRFQGVESPGKMKLATAGCPRNCSEAMVKDLGAVAVEGGRLGDLHRRRGGRAHPQGAMSCAASAPTRRC